MKKTIYLLLVALFVNCQSEKDDFLIREGNGVYSFKLKTHIKQVSKKIDGLTLKINRDSIVYAIDIEDEAYYTRDSLSVGTKYKTILDFRRMYDDSKVINKAINGKKTKFPFSMRYDGITFFLDDNGIVEKIRIY